LTNLRFKDFVFNHEHGRVNGLPKIPKINARSLFSVALALFYHRQNPQKTQGRRRLLAQALPAAPQSAASFA